MQKPALLLLVDGHALVHRAFHAIPAGFMTSRGEPTNAVFGFTSMLLKALDELEPDYAAVAFDRAAPTFRHVAYAGYKATRPRMSDDLRAQFARVREVVAALSIPVFEIDGYEADDVLGCLARQAEASGVDTIIMTGDLDTLQLVTPRVRVMAPRGRISDTTIYDVEAVRERYGLDPGQIPDLKALAGDTSDNIKGVPSIGPKTAAKLLADFHSIEELYRRLEDVPGKVRHVLAEHERHVRENKRLVTIDRSAPCVLDLEACRLDEYDRDAALALFQELEFRSLVGKLPRHRDAARDAGTRQMSLFDGGASNGRASDAPSAATTNVVASPAALEGIVESLRAAGSFVIHPVARQRSVIDFDVAGFALATSEEQGWYVPVAAEETPHHLLEAVALDILRPVLEDASIRKVAHNAKTAITLLAEHGVTLRGLAFDTMIGAYILNPSIRGAGIKELVFQQLGQEIRGTASLAAKGAGLLDRAVEDVAPEAVLEARLIDRLAGDLRRELIRHEQLDLFERIELPLIPVLSAMERTGVKVDVRVLAEMSRELAAQIRETELEIYNSVGHQFAINSTQQLAKVLVDELRLPLTRRTKTGYSTDATVLEELAGAHPAIEHILTYRQLTKLKSTYIDALPALINPRTGRIHTTFNQAVAATGRLSSEAPNLQNIPIRTEIGRKIRRAFVAEAPESVLLAADYTQIELRIAAHMTGDEQLRRAFEAGEDVHASTAATIFGVPLDQVTAEQRRLAKTTNFAVLYGITDFGLSQRVGITRGEAAPFIKAYIERHPGIRRYIEKTREQARERGYVETPLGRRRYIPELRSRNAALRAAGERAAINMPLQGAQADLIKLAMIAVQREIERRGLEARMILQVHDELVFEAPRRELDALASLVRHEMETAMTLDVPVKVDMGVGSNWYDMEPLPAPDA